MSILSISFGATRTVRIFAHGPSTSTLLSTSGLVEPRRACLPCQTESRSLAVPKASTFSSLRSLCCIVLKLVPVTEAIRVQLASGCTRQVVSRVPLDSRTWTFKRFQSLSRENYGPHPKRVRMSVAQHMALRKTSLLLSLDLSCRMFVNTTNVDCVTGCGRPLVEIWESRLASGVSV